MYFIVRRSTEETAWKQTNIMFNVLDSKQTWLGIKVEGDKIFTKKELLEKGENNTIFVLGFASNWSANAEKASDKANKRLKTQSGDAKPADTDAATDQSVFMNVPWDFLKDFQLRFFGTVGLESKGAAVPLVTEKDKEMAPSLPWQLFGQGWDSLMGSEMPCLAFIVPLAKMKGKTGKASKIKTVQFLSGSEPTSTGGTGTGASASKPTESDACEEMAAEAMGLSRKGGAKRKPKRKASKDKGTKSQVLSDSITFIEAPLLLRCSTSKIEFVCLRMRLDWTGLQACRFVYV